jgi:glucosamine-phosphate N-acetyltransferase
MEQTKNVQFEVREISEADLKKGFLETLSNLAEIGMIKNEQGTAKKVLQQVMSSPFYKIFVAAKTDGEIIGSITLLIEQKFIHNGGKVGHIEDVVTKNGYEGMGVGRAIVAKALAFAAEMKCYKVILDCSENNAQFYRRVGFKEHGLSMRHDLS